MAFTEWMPVSKRGSGDWYTADIAVPIGIDWVNARLDVVDANFSTPDLSVTAIIEYSIDGINWRPDLRVTWTGGPPPPKGGERIMGCNGISNFIGQRVRVHFITVGDFRWGLSGELI